MEVQFYPKEENPRELVITIDGDGYREVDTHFFKKSLASLPIKLANYAEVDEWFFSLEMRLSKRYAFYLLAQRSYPKNLLRKKIFDKKISLKTLDTLMGDLEGWGYFNDDEWICHFIEKEKLKGYGPKIIEMKLKEKKVDEEKIDQFLSSLYTEKKERKILQLLLEKSYKTVNLNDHKEKSQLLARLQRRGFSPPLIYQTVDIFQEHQNS